MVGDSQGKGNNNTLRDYRKYPGPQPTVTQHVEGLLGARIQVWESATGCSDFSPSLLSPLPTYLPSSLQISCVLFGLAESGQSLGGHEHSDLTDGSQHLNSSCYPSTCITDILLSYKHPEVSFSMEQAGV